MKFRSINISFFLTKEKKIKIMCENENGKEVLRANSIKDTILWQEVMKDIWSGIPNITQEDSK